jgi:hypothetical protein
MSEEIVKIDDATFKKITTTEKVVSVNDIQEEVRRHRKDINQLYKMRDQVLLEISKRQILLNDAIALAKSAKDVGVKNADIVEVVEPVEEVVVVPG